MDKQLQFNSSDARNNMIELNANEVESASGGVFCWFAVGYAVGTAIDQVFIKPLWY